jgi:hypothetical protein
MDKEIPKTKEKAIQYAIDWQQWQSEQDLPFSELIEWQNLFNTIASKYDLLDEFIENGII